MPVASVQLPRFVPFTHSPVPPPSLQSNLVVPALQMGESTSNCAYVHAAQTYEKDLLSVSQRKVHADNQTRVTSAFARLASEVKCASADTMTSLTHAVLSNLVDSGGLRLDCYREREQGPFGYGKYLLYSHDSVDRPCCLQLFAFKPGQRTPIHDHPCECMSFIVRGELIEETYSTREGRLGSLLGRENRPAHSVGAFSGDQLDIAHRLINDRFVDLDIREGPLTGIPLQLSLKAAPQAISIHLYQGMDGALREDALVTDRRAESRDLRRAVAAVSRVYVANSD